VPRKAIKRRSSREMGLGEGSSLGRAAPTPPGLGAAVASDAPAVAIELTRSQILRVCEVAAGSEAETDVPNGLAADARRLCNLLDEVARNPRPNFSRSLVLGLYVLACFPGDGGPVGIVKLAALLKMPTATVHRYLHTLIVAKLVERDGETRQYSLTPGLVARSAQGVEGE
jgi:hypothetical protein